MYKMSVKNIQEFYVLEAIEAGMTFADERTTFKRSFEKLNNDLKEYKSKLVDRMYDVMQWYIWAAALGEARHAERYCELYPVELSGYGRNGVQYLAHKYSIEGNIELVKQVFEQEWNCGGYGGEAWLNIVQSLELNVSKATFIDYVIDLEHNSGNVLDKSNDVLDLSGATDLRWFLDYKFSSDILKGERGVEVSPKTYEFVLRYKNIVDNEINIDVFFDTLEPVQSLDLEWGDEILSEGYNDFTYCDRCGDACDEDYMVTTIDSHEVCENCKDYYYTRCESCGVYEEDDTVELVDGLSVCANCYDDAETCEVCRDKTYDYDTSEEGDTVCYDCISDNTCDHCGELHTNMDEHIQDMHICKVCDEEVKDLGAHMDDEHKCETCNTTHDEDEPHATYQYQLPIMVA